MWIFGLAEINNKLKNPFNIRLKVNVVILSWVAGFGD